jgi:hypothetical protein
VFGGNEDAGFETEAREIGSSGLVFRIVHLVEDEQDGRLGLAEFLGERLVGGGEAVMGIDDEQDQIRGFHGDVRLDGDLGVEAVVDIAADAAGVDERAGTWVAFEGAEMRSRVTPGWSCTMAIFRRRGG